MEAYINKLVLECPCPPRGLKKVILEKFSHPGDFLVLSQPPINELPYVNRSFFYTMLQNLTLDHIVQVFTNLLLEKPVKLYQITLFSIDHHSGFSATINVAHCLLFSDTYPSL